MFVHFKFVYLPRLYNSLMSNSSACSFWVPANLLVKVTLVNNAPETAVSTNPTGKALFESEMARQMDCSCVVGACCWPLGRSV